MLSRVAESVYWVGRYSERAENTARLLEAYAALAADLPGDVFPGWGRLLSVTASARTFAATKQRKTAAAVARFMLADEANPNSALSCLERVRENLRTVRDVVPDAVWEQFNVLTLRQRKAARHLASASQRNVFTARTKTGCQQHVGILAGTMSRNAAYQFVLVGRAIERCDMVTRILDLHPSSEQPYAPACWRAVLKSLSAFHMYRLHAQPQVDGLAVARFLLQNPDFPRAVARALASTEAPLARLPHHDAPLSELRRTLSAVRRAPARRLRAPELSGLLDEVQARLARLHGLIEKTYFTPEGAR